jgi:hypothetical protein
MNKKLMLTVLAIIALVITAIVANNIGYERGFNACIEENNLYERYEEYR